MFISLFQESPVSAEEILIEEIREWEIYIENIYKETEELVCLKSHIFLKHP